MPDPEYNPQDRRPIPARELGLSHRVTALLVRLGTSPNTISWFGLFCALVAGLCLAVTPIFPPDIQRLLWLGAALLVGLRLAANMFDGMVAVATGSSSPIGELINEVPDRIADVAVLVGCGYAVGSLPALGYVSALLALFIAYLRAQGNALGIFDLFGGPMAKAQRMAMIIILGVVNSLTPAAWSLTDGWNGLGLAAAVLALIVVGELFSVWVRLRRIVGELKKR